MCVCITGLEKVNTELMRCYCIRFNKTKSLLWWCTETYS